MTYSINTEEMPTNFYYIREICEILPVVSYIDAIAIYREILNNPNLNDWAIAQIGLHDRFFFLTQILNVFTIHKTHKPEWIYERCREVEADPDDHLDFWAREHYKSTIITFAGSLQEIAKDSSIYPELFPDKPDVKYHGLGKEITIGIFSHNTKIARDFVTRIKRECESNSLLPRLYPDVFWQDPKKESPTWSRDDGLIFKRKSNPNEPTISGWGLVDGLPTSKHFKLMIYDDTVTEKSVTTPEMIIKTTDAWELSSFLESGLSEDEPARKWYIGTRYNFADTYQVMLTRKIAIPRIYPATDTGTLAGNPILLSPKAWEKKKKDYSVKVLSCQMLQNPLAGDEQEFKEEWLRKYELRPETLNIAITVDPASSKKKGSSNTAFVVTGIDFAFNKYLLDGAYHKMSLTERWKMLKYLYFKWLKTKGVQVVVVGYEKYGMQADIEHFKTMMRIQKCQFPITEVSWPRERELGAKDDRIRRLIPDHQNWRYFYPYEGEETQAQREAVRLRRDHLIARPIKRIDENKKVYNVVHKMIQNEYLFFPATTMKDFMDAQSRIYDLDLNPPIKFKEEDVYPEHHEDF